MGWPNFGGLVQETLTFSGWDLQNRTVFCATLAGASVSNTFRGVIHTIWIDSTAMTSSDIETAAKSNGKINSFRRMLKRLLYIFGRPLS